MLSRASVTFLYVYVLSMTCERSSYTCAGSHVLLAGRELVQTHVAHAGGPAAFATEILCADAYPGVA